MIDANASVFDQRSLAALRGESAGGGEAALDHAASEFEALFLRMMLKTMRDAVPASDLMGSDHLRQYQDMHDAQLAAHLSRNGGVGLANVISQQMRPQAASAAPSGPLALDAYTRAQRAAPIEVVQALPKDQQAFVDRIKPHAVRAAQRLGTTPETLIAQSALETGWGASLPAGSENYFGIKANRAWSGGRVSSPTTEFGPRGRETMVADFRSYRATADSFDDYASFVSGSDRYAAALGRSGEQYFQALADGGYATDPNYARKAAAIHERLKSSLSAPIVTERSPRTTSVAHAIEVR